jgi:hypothetical protein
VGRPRLESSRGIGSCTSTPGGGGSDSATHAMTVSAASLGLRVDLDTCTERTERFGRYSPADWLTNLPTRCGVPASKKNGPNRFAIHRGLTARRFRRKLSGLPSREERRPGRCGGRAFIIFKPRLKEAHFRARSSATARSRPRPLVRGDAAVARGGADLVPSS